MVLGINHEQQHQELMLTDIKHAFWMNPLRPIFRPEKPIGDNSAAPLEWRQCDRGLVAVGHDGGGFFFDNEGPRHQVFLNSFSLATRLVTNGEYLEFMKDAGYRRPELWLSLGWTVINERGWNAPLYWVVDQMFGEVWQWTQNGYSPYPAYKPAAGALGEYNGKFMCNQYVLRGASCATPKSHARLTYRNFFPPDARWQFLGIRLAKDME